MVTADSSLAAWYERMESAERSNGWLAWCEGRGLFVIPSDEFVAALREVAPADALEIGAGDGTLAGLLGIRATDPRGGPVEALDAREAIAKYAPGAVLTVFPPIDAGIEKIVLESPGVNWYLYIGPLIYGRPGPAALWRSLDRAEPMGWAAEEPEAVNGVLLTRLDHLADFTRATHRRGAGAVIFRRRGAL